MSNKTLKIICLFLTASVLMFSSCTQDKLVDDFEGEYIIKNYTEGETPESVIDIKTEEGQEPNIDFHEDHNTRASISIGGDDDDSEEIPSEPTTCDCN